MIVIQAVEVLKLGTTRDPSRKVMTFTSLKLDLTSNLNLEFMEDADLNLGKIVTITSRRVVTNISGVTMALNFGLYAELVLAIPSVEAAATYLSTVLELSVTNIRPFLNLCY